MRPLLLEAGGWVVGHLIAVVKAQVSIKAHLVLRIVHVEGGLFLLGSDAEDRVDSFFEMRIAEDLPESEVAVEGE
jgi:hypothetical protein